MKSATPKVLHMIGGRSLVHHAIAAARGVDPLEGLTPLAMFGIGGFAVLYSLWGALKQLNRRKSA